MKCSQLVIFLRKKTFSTEWFYPQSGNARCFTGYRLRAYRNEAKRIRDELPADSSRGRSIASTETRKVLQQEGFSGFSDVLREPSKLYRQTRNLIG